MFSELNENGYDAMKLSIENKELKEKLTKTEALLGKALDALEFYADPENWGNRTCGHGDSCQDTIKNDGGYFNCAGERARKTLQEVGNK